MPPPLAYFLTWTSYGTWLHGDPRESVDDAHRAPGAPRAPENLARERANRGLLKQQAVVLSDQERHIVENAIRAHCAHRGWRLLAVNARSNHVHVVVACAPDTTPERALSEFKAWATRRLREAGLRGDSDRLWTHHGSTRWINDRDGLAEVVDYVENRQ